MTVGLVSCPAEKTNFPLVHSCAGAAAWPRHWFVLHEEKKQKQIRFFQWRTSLWHQLKVLAHLMWNGWGREQTGEYKGREQIHDTHICKAAWILQGQWKFAAVWVSAVVREIFVLGVFQAWVEDTVPALRNLYLGIKFSFHTMAGTKSCDCWVPWRGLCVRSWWKNRMGQSWGHLSALGQIPGNGWIHTSFPPGLGRGVCFGDEDWMFTVYWSLEWLPEGKIWKKMAPGLQFVIFKSSSWSNHLLFNKRAFHHMVKLFF